MTKAEAKRLVHSAVFRIVRQPQPIPPTQFFEKKIGDTIPTVSPSGWAGFYYESVAVEIQAAVMTRQEYVLDFSGKWLHDNKGKKWKKVIDHMGENLVPLS